MTAAQRQRVLAALTRGLTRGASATQLLALVDDALTPGCICATRQRIVELGGSFRCPRHPEKV